MTKENTPSENKILARETFLDRLAHIASNRKIRTGVALTILGGIILASCSPKERSRWSGEDFSYSLGMIPKDVCMVDGNPYVLNASTESDGDFNLIYVRNNGDIVVKHWALAPVIGVVLREAGEFYWEGGKCPSSR